MKLYLMLEIIDCDIKYKLGKNAKENFELIDESFFLNPNYWWFHVDEHPSGHCVVFSDILNRENIIFAAKLVKEHSKLKLNNKVKIIYTQIKNIKKTKICGQVIILNKPNIITV